MYKQGYRKYRVFSEDGLNKLILLFKQNQVDRYEQCDQHVSIYCFRLEKF